jgi:hypothetical protein
MLKEYASHYYRFYDTINGEYFPEYGPRVKPRVLFLGQMQIEVHNATELTS